MGKSGLFQPLLPGWSEPHHYFSWEIETQWNIVWEPESLQVSLLKKNCSVFSSSSSSLGDPSVPDMLSLWSNELFLCIQVVCTPYAVGEEKASCAGFKVQPFHVLPSLLLSFPQTGSPFYSPALNLSSVGHQLREHTCFVWWINEFKWSPYTAEMCGKENLCQCETCVCLSRGWGIWFINQWQGGKERCVGLGTTVRLKWCILFFFILSLPRRSYFWLTCFLSGAGQSLKHPEGQCAPISCHLVIPGDAVGTKTLSGSAEYSLEETKAGCKSCLRTVSQPSGWVETWSVLMLQWVAREEI